MAKSDIPIFNGVAAVEDRWRGAVLTVGNFDGVHRGHQRILRKARALARVSSAGVLAMTFDPHPLTLLRPDNAPKLITPFDEKARLLIEAGADAVARLNTDQQLLSLPAEQFVRDVLVKQIHPSYIVEGPDFGFGHGREGNVDTLRELSAKGGFQVAIVEPYQLRTADDATLTVSSSAIRVALTAGNVRLAHQCMGRPFTMFGHVIHGEAEGRKLGYPTINLDVSGQIIPGEGVYAGVADLGDRRRTAAISVGQRPTLGGTSLVVEAFLLDESDDLYDRRVRLEFHTFVRAQRRFESREALTAQIGVDIEVVREAITEERLAGERTEAH